MVRFFLNDQLFNDPADWGGFGTQFLKDFTKRIISVKYTDTVTFTGAAHDYIRSVYDTSGYCADISLRIEEQCERGPWAIMARGTIIVADCEWNETKCSVQCSVADNGIGARVANNMGVPVSPLADLSKNGVSIAPVTPIALRVFATNGSLIAGARRAFDWYASIEHAVAFIGDGDVAISSDWYAALPDEQKIALAAASELRTSGFNTPRISWTFDELFTEISKKYNLWIFATEDGAGNATLRIEPESTFLGTSVINTVLNIEDLIRKTDTDRLYATVNVGSSENIVELGSANPMPYVPLLSFTDEVFSFSGVCNTEASLDLLSEWIIDTNVIYQIVEQNNDEWDKEIVVVQYTESTSEATSGTYFFPGLAPYLYNEQLVNANVVGRFPLPSAVGAYLGPGFDDSFLAEYTDPLVAAIVPWLMDYFFVGAYATKQLGFDNDYAAPNFDVNNVWGSDNTPGLPVPISESDFKASADGAYVFTLGIVVDVTAVVPLVINPTFGDVSFQTVAIRVHANIYDAGGALVQTVLVGTTQSWYLVGTYEPYEMSIALSMSTDYRVRFFGTAVKTGTRFGDGNDPTTPQPDGNGDNEGDVRMTMGVGSWVRTTKIANGSFVVPATGAQTESFSFDRSTTSTEWLAMIRNPGSRVLIDGNRYVYQADMRRRVTGETSFEMIKEP